MLLSGYACEKDQCLRMYIHINPAMVNDTPQANHHQLVNCEAINDHVHEALPIALSASFMNNCPPQRNRLCMTASSSKRRVFILSIYNEAREPVLYCVSYCEYA